MALHNYDRKNGLQLGTVTDRCMECAYKHRHEEDYEPERLDYKPVYKIWINNLPHCMCMNCFMETLGDYILFAPGDSSEEEVKEEKPKTKKTTKKKEADKDGSETA